VYNQYFGQYLLNKELLSAEQLRDILNRERLTRPRLGLLAIDAGLLTVAQVEKIHSLQHAMDKKFGEIAVEKNFLTIKQVEDLLITQRGRRLKLSQAIVDAGYLSLSRLEAVWEQYKAETNLADGKIDTLYGNLDNIVRAVVDFSSAGTKAKLLYEYIALMLRIIPRFFDEEPILTLSNEKVQGTLISQTMTGVISISTGVIMNDELLLEMAKRYSGEELIEVNELALDSIAEFLNETNGIFTVNMSESGFELNLEPQEVQGDVLPSPRAYRIPIEISCGTIDLFICIGDKII